MRRPPQPGKKQSESVWKKMTLTPYFSLHILESGYFDWSPQLLSPGIWSRRSRLATPESLCTKTEAVKGSAGIDLLSASPQAMIGSLVRHRHLTCQKLCPIPQ